MPTNSEGPTPEHTLSNATPFSSSKDNVGAVSVVSNATQTSALRARIIVNDSQPSGVPAVSTSPTLTIPSTRGYLLFALPLEEDEGGDDIIAQEGDNPGTIRTKNPKSVWTTIYWKRYFRPMLSKAHYKAFVHVALLDSIFACLAWSFLFMCITFTSISPRPGVSLFIMLPVFAIGCFVALLGSRVFARIELASQTLFHGPTVVDSPYRSYPVFTRYQATEVEDVEMGQHAGGVEVKETSFLMNARSMFLAQTSYQALIYFLLLKPAIRLVLTIFFVVVSPIAFALIIPIPHLLRTARRIGIWQANIAMEGLMRVEWHNRRQPGGVE